MEGLGAEVSNKIRSAIKAKLIELEAYVDDELPDYIMVMVANKRTKEQMEDDLGLFLNNNTGAFTHWLHAVLEKLQKVTLGEVAKSKKDVRKKKKPTKESSSSKRPKEGKESQKRERERKASSSVPRRDGSSRSSRSSKKPREEPKQKPEPTVAVIPKGIPREVKGSKGTANPNIEALGKRQPKKTDSPAGGGLGSGGGDGYDPSSLLKNAIAKTKTVSKPKLVAKKPSSPASKKISSPSLKKVSSSSKRSSTKKVSTKKDSSRKSKSSKKSAADIFKEDGDEAPEVQLNLSHEDKSDPMFANVEDKAVSESEDKKKMINLKEDSEFHSAKRDEKQNLDFEIKKRGEREKAEKEKTKKAKDESRSRSREPRKKKEESRSRSRIRRESSPDKRKGRKGISLSRSGSRERAGLASKVVKPARHGLDNDYDAEKMLKRSLVSRAQIPPRPVRPSGREEKGSARAISRAVAAADRSIMISKRREDSPPRGMRSRMDSPPKGRRDRSPRGRRSESPSRRFGPRGRDWDARPGVGRMRDDRDDRRERVPRLSPDDIEKYKAMKEKYALKRQAEHSLETRRLNDEGKRGRRNIPERRLAMDDEMEKRGRRSSLDRKLDGRRGGVREEERRHMDNKEDDDIRIIVRRDISPESPPKRRLEEVKRKEEDGRRQEQRRQREQERRLDEDDDELLEMRKKALESLMRRRSREDAEPGERKIIIPLDDDSSSDSDTSSSSKDSQDDEVSLSDVEDLQAKSRELERRARNRQGQDRSRESRQDQGRSRESRQEQGRSRDSRQERKREVKEEEGSDHEREPTFTVTLDGIDEKYFKKSGPLNAPLPLVRQSPEKTEDDPQNESFNREEESDQELVLHPTEDFDEPEPAKEVNSSKKKVSQEEKEDLKEKFSPKPLKPTLSSTDAKTSKPIAPVTGRKRSPIRGPTEKVKAVPVKKVAAVKPSVAAVIKPIPVVKPAKPASSEQKPKIKASSEQKPKIKRTPITAPEPDTEPTKQTFSRTISNTNYTRAISAPVYSTAPVALQTKSGETCKFWPHCKRGEACIFYHPPVPTSAEVILSNKYKWTAN